MMYESKADSNVRLHTNCYLPAWLAKHRQAADLFTNMRDWRCLQDCGNCMAMKQSVTSYDYIWQEAQKWGTLWQIPSSHRQIQETDEIIWLWAASRLLPAIIPGRSTAPSDRWAAMALPEAAWTRSIREMWSAEKFLTFATMRSPLH